MALKDNGFPHLEVVDGPSEVTQHRVPTVLDEVPVATYQDWRKEDTRVISCRIANNVYPGERYESRDEALAATKLKFGRVYEAQYTPGRAFFRVKR